MAVKDSNYFRRIVVKLGIILSLIGLVAFSLIFYVVGNNYDQTLEDETYSATNLITSAIEATDQAAETYERLVDWRMYSVSKAIAVQLKGRSLKSITENELAALRDEWSLSDVSLFVRKGDDIVVAKSSDKKEVGLSSKDWGYWFTAYQQLFELRPVQVEEGFSKKYFWAGPLIKSVLYSKQFLYAYYYDGTTDYIINPYISANDVQHFIDAYGPNWIIDKILKDSPHIAGIEVLNIRPFLDNDQSEVVEPKKDSPVLYGKQSFPLPGDRAVLRKGKEDSVYFQHQGIKYKKIYVPLANKREMIIVMDISKRDRTMYHILEMMVIIYVVAFGIIYAIIRWANARSVYLLEVIRKMAYYDELTGIPNRNYFQEYLKTMFDDRRDHCFALFMIDLDNFKTINDSLGHAAGDQLLVNASHRFSEQLNGNGFLARIGGDEFTLVLPIDAPQDAENVAEGLLSSFREPFLLDGHEFAVSMSIGISLYPHHGRDTDSLLKCADIALYCEKYKAKNNFSIFEFSMSEYKNEDGA
ncbi:diguanylate cyclase (GGDEF)-like protein [Paenibacillus taihuensis]|uniref:Diguanylate cyclase (GGDEF)-like protein n=1 Tax=Paenibacillus taihuensis TaxID=1156355 RepID=A0A3D9SCC2_9BACL|nr:GGDEF domain-containing protein [Paenibacillus taihuensis]REE91531.1 diguanylate cyclase (GGDEF)-like protein [Paenibacillus taihuensis]